MRAAASRLLTALPLGLVFMCGLTLRTTITQGSESMVSYGFPLAWYAPDPVTSMAYVIAIGPLCLDFVAHAAAAWLALRWLPATWQHKTARLGVPVLWAAALLSAGLHGLALSGQPHFVAWTLSTYFGAEAPRSYGLQLGPGR